MAIALLCYFYGKIVYYKVMLLDHAQNLQNSKITAQPTFIQGKSKCPLIGVLRKLSYFQVLPPGAKGDVGVNLDKIRPIEDVSTYFSDGIRKIDFVLVYSETGEDAIDFQDLGHIEENNPLAAEYDQFSK